VLAYLISSIHYFDAVWGKMIRCFLVLLGEEEVQDCGGRSKEEERGI
tara:strand:- start:1244 stop:1384 length:141 start_codon:yes stop_codon:yes gene_type:complete